MVAVHVYYDADDVYTVNDNDDSGDDVHDDGSNNNIDDSDVGDKYTMMRMTMMTMMRNQNKYLSLLVARKLRVTRGFEPRLHGPEDTHRA